MQISRKALVAIYTSIPAPIMGMYVALTVYTALATLAASHTDISDFATSLGYAAGVSVFAGVMAFGITAFGLNSAAEAIICPDAAKA